MPTAEIIAIGTELLLGEIQDTNTHYLARHFRDAGIDLFRASMVGDNTKRISQAILEAAGRSQIIITTGGLGPTVDDPTRQAVAMALGVEVEFQEELWQQILARFDRMGRKATENNRRQAYIPRGASAIPNAVGTAPAFSVDLPGGSLLISLPGVPREMEYLYENAVLPLIRQRFQLKGIILARVLHVSGMGESQVDELIGELEELANPTVGLAAHSGQIDVRITAKAASRAAAEKLILPMESTIRERLGNSIYGADDDTLEGQVAQRLQALGWKLALVEFGRITSLGERLRTSGLGDNLICPANQERTCEELLELTRTARVDTSADVALGICLQVDPDRQVLFLQYQDPHGEHESERFFAGPPASVPIWAANFALDFLHRQLPES
jgi:nicotinamide-nucleotide amidase